MKNILSQSIAVSDFVSDAVSVSAASPQKRRTWAHVEGLPLPLGVSWIEEDHVFNFAVCAEHAESVKLSLYSPADLAKPVLTFRFDPIRNKSGRIWHCRIPRDQICDARYYAYSVSGQAVAGVRGFDHEKVLLDPYAKSVFFPPGFDRNLAMKPGPNAGKGAAGSVAMASCRLSIGREMLHPALNRTRSSTNFTSRDSPRIPIPVCIPREPAPTAGLVEKIPYLKELGITVVELMPIFQRDPHEGDYWGYMPLNFFAPHAQYASSVDDRWATS